MSQSRPLLKDCYKHARKEALSFMLVTSQIYVICYALGISSLIH